MNESKTERWWCLFIHINNCRETLQVLRLVDMKEDATADDHFNMENINKSPNIIDLIAIISLLNSLLLLLL